MYDVSIATADPKPIFNDDIAYTYKTEAEAMLQELDDKDSIIEAITQERDETEDALNLTLLDALHHVESKVVAQEETIARLQLLDTKLKHKPKTKQALQRK